MDCSYYVLSFEDLLCIMKAIFEVIEIPKVINFSISFSSVRETTGENLLCSIPAEMDRYGELLCERIAGYNCA